jgi:cell division protein FtsQ
MSGLAATLARRRRRLMSIPRLPEVSPRLKRRLLALVVLSLLLAGGYQFWLRDSSLVAVDEVKISGLTTADAPRVRSSLASAAKAMTTLNIDRERLARAVAAYPVVRDLQVSPEFPHGLRVRVIEHVPAAMAVSDAGQVPVAGDGTILRGLPVEGKLPTVDVDGILGGERLRDADARAAAAVAGAAPAVLRRRIEAVAKVTEQGYVATLREGPELIFGTATQLPAKWAAAARVLADSEAEGASYIDLRIAGRPAAGGLSAPTVTPAPPAGTAPPQTVPPEDAAAADPSAAQVPTDPSLPADPTTGTAPETPGATTAAPGATGATTATPLPDPTAPPATTTPPEATPVPAPGGGVEGGVTAPDVP